MSLSLSGVDTLYGFSGWVNDCTSKLNVYEKNQFLKMNTKKQSALEMILTILKIRSLFEERKIAPTLLKELYKVYNPLPHMEQFIEKSQLFFPNLNCGITSLYLKHILKEGKLINGGYAGQNHTFLFLNKGLIIDITADQFGGPPVYVGPMLYPWSF